MNHFYIHCTSHVNKYITKTDFSDNMNYSSVTFDACDTLHWFSGRIYEVPWPEERKDFDYCATNKEDMLTTLSTIYPNPCSAN